MAAEPCIISFGNFQTSGEVEVFFVPILQMGNGLTEVKSTDEDVELGSVRSWASTQELELWVSWPKGRLNGFPVHYCNWVLPTLLAPPDVRKTDPQKDALKSIQMRKEIKET